MINLKSVCLGLLLSPLILSLNMYVCVCSLQYIKPNLYSDFITELRTWTIGCIHHLMVSELEYSQNTFQA